MSLDISIHNCCWPLASSTGTAVICMCVL
jgi:hypothetical protein